MKKRMFKVSFKKGDPVEVYAFSKSQAKILAQAERIKQGKFYDVISIEEASEF